MKWTFVATALSISYVSCIQNGTNVTDQSKYPFYIMIGSPHVCGGTLISYDPALILTAAHCVDAPTRPENHTKNNNPYFVLYKDIYRDKQKAVGIADWNIHPLYNVSGEINVKYDAAIVRLEKPLQRSSRVKRIPFWSTSLSPHPSKGELIGFGYKDIDGHFAQTLQVVDLDITKIDTKGDGYIESKTDSIDKIACHGDSGGPLIIHQNISNPSTNKTVTVPFVLGSLTRIFGAHDKTSALLTCPVPNTSGKDNQVTEIFTNVVSLLGWISDISGISESDLTNPFYSNYKGAKRKPNQSSTISTGEQWDNDDEIDEADDSDDDSSEGGHRTKWSIGFVADENGLLDPTGVDNFLIGSIKNDFYLKAAQESSSTVYIQPKIAQYVLALFTLLIHLFIT